jgi:hypothetical protein
MCKGHLEEGSGMCYFGVSATVPDCAALAVCE